MKLNFSLQKLDPFIFDLLVTEHYPKQPREQ